MTNIVHPLPIEKLQKVFAKWEEAPLGTLLSSAAYSAWHTDEGWQRSNDSFVALRANSSMGAALVVLSPNSRVLFDSKQRPTVFTNPAVADGPAIDIGGSHQFLVADLAPTNSKTELAPGDVVMDLHSEKIFLVVDYPDYANLGLVLRGDDQWNITQFPHQGVVKIGVASVGVIKRSSEQG